jgi:diketogulonate reductase-like aldo/keto reductase
MGDCIFPSFVKGHTSKLTGEREYRKKTAQVGFINIQQGVVVIPKGFNPEGIKENVQIFDFSLTEDDRH